MNIFLSLGLVPHASISSIRYWRANKSYLSNSDVIANALSRYFLENGKNARGIKKMLSICGNIEAIWGGSWIVKRDNVNIRVLNPRFVLKEDDIVYLCIPMGNRYLKYFYGELIEI